MSIDFSMVTIQDIIEYIGVLLSKLFGFDRDTVDNVGTMYDELSKYEPEV